MFGYIRTRQLVDIYWNTYGQAATGYGHEVKLEESFNLLLACWLNSFSTFDLIDLTQEERNISTVSSG